MATSKKLKTAMRPISHFQIQEIEARLMFSSPGTMATYPPPPVGATTVSYGNTIVFIPPSPQPILSVNLLTATSQYFYPTGWSSYQLVNNDLVLAPATNQSAVNVIDLSANTFAIYSISTGWSSELSIGSSVAFLPAAGTGTQFSLINLAAGLEINPYVETGWTDYKVIDNDLVFTNLYDTTNFVNIVSPITGATQFTSIASYSSEVLLGNQLAFLPPTAGGTLTLFDLTTAHQTVASVGGWNTYQLIDDTSLLFSPASGVQSPMYRVNLNSGVATTFNVPANWATQQFIGHNVAFIGSPGGSATVINIDSGSQNYFAPFGWTGYQVVNNDLLFSSSSLSTLYVVNTTAAAPQIINLTGNAWRNTQLIGNWIVFVPPAAGGAMSAVNLTTYSEFGFYIPNGYSSSVVNTNLVFATNGSPGNVYATDLAVGAMRQYYIPTDWQTEQVVGNNVAFIPAAPGTAVSSIAVTPAAANMSLGVYTIPFIPFTSYKVVNNDLLFASTTSYQATLVDLSARTTKTYSLAPNWTGTQEVVGNQVAFIPPTSGGSVTTINLLDGTSQQSTFINAWASYKLVGTVLVFAPSNQSNTVSTLDINSNSFQPYVIFPNWTSEEVVGNKVLFISSGDTGQIVEIDLSTQAVNGFGVPGSSNYKIIGNSIVFAPGGFSNQVYVVDLLAATFSGYSIFTTNYTELVMGNAVAFIPNTSSDPISVVTLSRSSTVAEQLSLPASTNLTLSADSGGGTSVDLFSTITIATNATLRAAAPDINPDRLLLSTTGLSIAGSSGNWTGTLDLNGNDMVVTGGDLATIASQVTAGFANGTWGGRGIINFAASVDPQHLTTLGVIQNSTDGTTPLYDASSPLGTFDGISPGPNAILIKATYYGDTNLDGRVDASDYSRIDAGYIAHLTGWANGDLNYDGVVNGSDYTLIDNAFNRQGAVLTSELSSTSAKSRPIFAAHQIFAAATYPWLDQPAGVSTLEAYRKQNHKPHRAIEALAS